MGGAGLRCVSARRRRADVVRGPRDLGSVTQSNATEDGARQINRVSTFVPL